MRAFTALERPELVERAAAATSDAFPEYNSHGDVIGRYWGRLVDERPEFQLHLVDEEDTVVARIRSLPLRWDGTVDDLPAGIDGAIARGSDEGGANVLCAMVITIPRALQGGGMSRVALGALADLAHAHGLKPLIAPVRPSWKERYPLVPIERYATWRRADGLLLDPWLRVHESGTGRYWEPNVWIRHPPRG